MLNALKRLLRRDRGYSCYFVVLHFPSAEAAAEHINGMGPSLGYARMLRGGERIPLCQEVEDE